MGITFEIEDHGDDPARSGDVCFVRRVRADGSVTEPEFHGERAQCHEYVRVEQLNADLASVPDGREVVLRVTVRHSGQTEVYTDRTFEREDVVALLHMLADNFAKNGSRVVDPEQN